MNVGVIQARMGSSRLPGKMMLPLDGTHVIEHVVERVTHARTIDEVVVATSDRTADDILERYASRAGATVFRGDESDVLGRMYAAARAADADVVVRITGDCPLLPPACIDTVVSGLVDSQADYVSNVLEESFPRGCSAEAFTFETFTQVEADASKPYEREHVTPLYRESPERFDRRNVTARDVFDRPSLQGRTDLRLTLDEADDYELLKTVFENCDYDGLLSLSEAVRYIDERDLATLNQDVDQITLDEVGSE